MSHTSRFESISEFNYFLDSMLAKGLEAPLIVAPVFLNCAPEELPNIASGREISAKTELITEDIFDLKIGLRKRFAKGYLANYGEYWCAFFIPDKKDSPISEVASRWMHDMFPIVTPAYLHSTQLLEITEGLRVVEKSEIELLDYVNRSAKKGETTKHWGGAFSKDGILSHARNDAALVDAVRIEFSSPNFKLRMKLNRRGMITLYGGSYSELQRLVISKIISLAKSNLLAMRDRERVMQKGEVKVEPLRIKPEIDLTYEDMKQIKESLSEHYMVAVLYGGNPWLMMSLLDKSDGSAIDLQAYHDEIIITPVIRVSKESLTRLYSVLEEILPSSVLQIA